MCHSPRPSSLPPGECFFLKSGQEISKTFYKVRGVLLKQPDDRGGYMGLTRWGLLRVATIGLLIAGCGQGGVGGTTVRAGNVEAAATRTLMDSFNTLYAAAFTRLDANRDGVISEYEAGPFIDIKDMVQADTNRNGSLTQKEFMNYALRGFFFGWIHIDNAGVYLGKYDKNVFAAAQRRVLMNAFNRLDVNNDKLLKPSELAGMAISRTKLSISLMGLKTTVTIREFYEDHFEKADHTNDGSLSQAEFEDYAMLSFIGLINPGYYSAPSPAPTWVPS
jgi:Ca2+-binding EF-hand superfamily protein